LKKQKSKKAKKEKTAFCRKPQLEEPRETLDL